MAQAIRRIARFVTPIMLMVLPVTGMAQSTGALRGVVTDEEGRPLAGVTVSVVSTGSGVAGRGAVTDASGNFSIAALPPHTDYQVVTAYPGFATVRLTDVILSAGQTTLVRVSLQRETVFRERVEVRARAQPVVLETTTTQTEISAEFIDALPLLGRNYQDLLALAPGVTDVDGDGNPNIHGARDTDVVTLVDGVSTTDPLTGKIGAQLNIESIQAIEVKTAGATAEFSRAQGGFVNIITKSGGNDFQGTFKFFWRGSFLDGDGAGIDDPRLHGGVGEVGLRELSFNDYLPFLSLEGPIVRDRAWFFTAHEYVSTEEPVNAINAAFVTGVREFREFAKVTWQASPAQRLALSLNYDPQEFTNQGLNSLISEESGFTLRQGGPIVTLKMVSILGPTVSLESAISSFNERPSRESTLDPDTNGNGIQWIDRNGNGFIEASETDAGEDYDQDGWFDVFEDFDGSGSLAQDIDGDGRLTVVPLKGSFSGGGCEGDLREDRDCDGHLDLFNEDFNNNGVLDPGEDIDADGRLDDGTEDRNGNRRLDDRPGHIEFFIGRIVGDPDTPGVPCTPGEDFDDCKPFVLPGIDPNPAGEFYPYGHRFPTMADRQYVINQQKGITTGPFFEDFSDRRRRFTLRQDLSFFQPDYWGSHDVKMGYVIERENFNRITTGRPILAPIIRTRREGPSTVRALIPAERKVHNEATSTTTGVYLQDNYKPFPNLSIGVGLRLDREVTDSFGFSFFDPVDERAQFDRINQLIGVEKGQSDLLVGNADGIVSQGFPLTDPLFRDFVDPRRSAAFITNPLLVAALSRMTRHHTEADFVSQQLATLFPEIREGREVDAARLAELGVLAQVQEGFRLTNNNLAPRISVSWDPWSDGRTKVFAAWGRYYDKLFLSTIVGEEGPDTINRYYLIDESGVTGAGLPNNQIGTVISKAPPSATQVDRGLQTPWSDEFTFGVEREIAPEVALSVTYIARNFRQQLQDIDVNHSLRIDPGTGQPLDLFGRLPASFGLTGTVVTAPLPDGRPDLFIHNFFFNQVLRVGNFNEARYRGIELSLVKRLSRRWELKGSYTYSRALGAAEEFQSRLGNDPSTIESEFGHLDFDQRHVVKINGITFLPGDWQLGVSASWASGLPFSVVSRFFALDNADFQQFRTRFGFVDKESKTFTTERRNSRRNDATFDLSLRARKTIVLGNHTAGVFLEIFNVLNSDDLRILTFEPVPPEFSGSGETFAQGPLQLNATRRFGRRFQVGFQFDF